MTREKLLQLKQENRGNPVLYNLIGVIIGECDRVGKDLSKEQIIAVMKKIHKNNVETIENLIDLDSAEHTQKLIDLNAETLFLHSYIPKQLDEGEIRDIIDKCIDNGLTTMKELMQFFKEDYSGLYDGKLVSTIIKNYL